MVQCKQDCPAEVLGHKQLYIYIGHSIFMCSLTALMYLHILVALSTSKARWPSCVSAKSAVECACEFKQY